MLGGTSGITYWRKWWKQSSCMRRVRKMGKRQPCRQQSVWRREEGGEGGAQALHRQTMMEQISALQPSWGIPYVGAGGGASKSCSPLRAHAGEGFLSGTAAHGESPLKQTVPEELFPVGKTHPKAEKNNEKKGAAEFYGLTIPHPSTLLKGRKEKRHERSEVGPAKRCVCEVFIVLSCFLPCYSIPQGQ